MSKHSLLALILLLLNIVINNRVFSQTNPRHFASVSVGAAYNITSALEQDLGGSDFLGQGTRLNAFTPLLGLGYYYIRAKGLVIGSTGYVYHVKSRAVNGEVNLRTAHVFLNMGYGLLDEDKWIAFPYAGVGLTGMSFNVRNKDEHKDIVIYRDTISAGNKSKYDAGGLAFDFGMAFKFNKSGFGKVNRKKTFPVVGLDIGSSVFPSFAYWLSHSRHDTMLSLKSPFLITPYVKVTLGIGKWSKTADHRVW